jgi:hypothetical protein
MPDTETIAPETTEAVDVEQSPVEAASARWTEAQYGPETAVETPEAPEAAPEEKAAPEAKVEAEPEIDPAFLARAESYGLGKEHLSGIDPQRVEDMFAAFDRRLLTQSSPQAPPVVEPNPAPAAEVAAQPFELTLDPDEVGEPVINAFKGLQTQFQEKLSAYEERDQQREQQIRSLNTMMEIQAFDGFLAGMGEQWNDVFGKGATLDLNENSKEFKERGKLLQQAFALRDVYASKFGQNLPRAELFKRAHAAVYSDEIRKRQLSELNGKMKERAKQHTERPGKQERPPAAPREQAENTWKVGMRKIRNY